MKRRSRATIVTGLATVLALLAPMPATAAVAVAPAVAPVVAPVVAPPSTAQRVALVAILTASSNASYRAWDAARRNQAAWSGYGLDWSTDYCTLGPDQPLGFDFRLGCWRHDFGYRNYRALGGFAANKQRLDNALLFDLANSCLAYRTLRRVACMGLAWAYFQAVVTFGVA